MVSSTTTADSPFSLTQLPPDLLLDLILPQLSFVELSALASSCTHFHQLLSGPIGEVFWKRRCRDDFHFPVENEVTGRRFGWKQVFEKLRGGRNVYLWGQNKNGRLGIDPYDRNVSTSYNNLNHRGAGLVEKPAIIQGGYPVPIRWQPPLHHQNSSSVTPLAPNQVRTANQVATPPSVPTHPTTDPFSITHLTAGGWSFHALTTEGRILAWGTLDGEQYSRGEDRLEPGMESHEPIEIGKGNPFLYGVGGDLQTSLKDRVVQLEAGRSHAIARTQNGGIFEYRCFGRIYGIILPVPLSPPPPPLSSSSSSLSRPSNSKQHNPQQQREVRVKAVEAGWNHSAALFDNGMIFVWWEADERLREARDTASTTGESSSSQAWFTRPDAVLLPDLPSEYVDDEVEKVASGDHFLIVLTGSGRMYYFDLDLSGIREAEAPPQMAERGDDNGGGDFTRTQFEESQQRRRRMASLRQAIRSGERQWVYMKKFCDKDTIRMMIPSSISTVEESNREDHPEERIITHISAHFNSFVAYSVPSRSNQRRRTSVNLDGVVDENDDLQVQTTTRSHVNSEAASGSSLVLFGKKGWSPTDEPEVIPELQGKDVIKIVQGDYHKIALTSSGQLYSWGSYSAGALGLGHPLLKNTPFSDRGMDAQPGASRPTRIRFPGDDPQGNTFVFDVCAGGWHSGALAVDMRHTNQDVPAAKDKATVVSSSGHDESQSASQSTPTSTSTSTPTPPNPLPSLGDHLTSSNHGEEGTQSHIGQGGPFRIGFAGRGAMRGGFGARGWAARGWTGPPAPVEGGDGTRSGSFHPGRGQAGHGPVRPPSR